MAALLFSPDTFDFDALMKLFAHFRPGEVRAFLREHLAEAWIWIQE